MALRKLSAGPEPTETSACAAAARCSNPFFSLDGAAYAPGALPVSVKELLGLVVSVMKDCEECVYYHLERCDEERVARDQVLEALQIALVGGGSVTIPLLRRAVSYMEKLPDLGEGKA
ncbi:carboxymuconolactone decarboxylase family protein [Nonomuraea sp. NPDC050202]|uniref:carboxymuconolactone decarboxylase family protein n=1 Tax=Nonomuraea sp. NPDC050202 TaxID=3155035 RepID=UPI0033D7C829